VARWRPARPAAVGSVAALVRHVDARAEIARRRASYGLRARQGDEDLDEAAPR